MPWYFTFNKATCKIKWKLICYVKAGNEEYDRRRTQLQAGEKARSHIKFEEISRKRKRDEAGKPKSSLDLRAFGGSEYSSHPTAYTLTSRSAPEEPNVDSSDDDSSSKSSSEQGKLKKKRKHQNWKRRRNSGKGEAKPSQNASKSPIRNHFFLLIAIV